MADGSRRVRTFVQEHVLGDGRKLMLLAEGRLINLAAAEGHPSDVMDMSFANQALCVEYLNQAAHNMEPQVYQVPRDIDEEIGRIKLETMGIEIDTLTPEQVEYLASWDVGT